MWRGKKSVIRVAQHVAALVPVEGLSSLFPNVYCFFDPPSTFVGFSVQNCSGRPINHVVILRCMVSQCWFVLLRQTWCTVVSGKRFTSYGLHLCLMFFQSCAKFSSSPSYVTFLTAWIWNSVYIICNFLFLLFVLWMIITNQPKNMLHESSRIFHTKFTADKSLKFLHYLLTFLV